MHNILSFFLSILILFVPCSLFGTDTKNEEAFSLSYGISLQTFFLNTKVFSEYKMEEGKITYNTIKSWGVKLIPFEIVNINIGTLTNSGIWSRFTTIAPFNLAPLKRPYAIQSRLITNLPSKSTTSSPLSVQASLDIASLKISMLTTDVLGTAPSFGLGISIPFIIDESKDILKSSIKGQWSIAWRMIEINPKTYNTWYIHFPSFIKSYFHTGVQELSLKSHFHTTLLGMGISQNPYDGPRGFLRGEHSYKKNGFLLNSSIFFSNDNYLKQNGNFEKKLVVIGLNPQLEYNYYGSFIRSTRFGFSSNSELAKTDESGPALWSSSLSFANEIEMVFFNIETVFSVSDISFLSKNPFIEFSESVTSLQGEIHFRPWTLPLLPRTWAITGEYTKEISHLYNQGDLRLELELTAFYAISDKIDIIASIFGESNFLFEKPPILNSMTYAFELKSNIILNAFQKKQSVQVASQFQIDFEKTVLRKTLLTISLYFII